jgi:D-alanyl-D-alanine carboxypeptidase/D-alanyl-D-alanine-endopeptidase (penicillin-binding protein 4)
MKRLRLLALFSCLSVLLLPAAARADLNSDIQAVLDDKLLKKGAVAVEVVRLGATAADDQTIYESNAATPLIPASNLKLITTAAALDKLGPNFKYKTELRLTPENDLVLVGDGDPALGDAEYLKKVGWKTTTLFEWWAVQLREKQDVKTVRDVIVDDSVFDQEMLHPRWPSDQVHKRYVPEVAGLNLNANCVDFQIINTGPGKVVQYTLDPATRYVSVRNTCVGGNNNAIWLSREATNNDIILRGESRGSTQQPVSVTVHDPSMFAATVFAEMLAANNIRREGQVRRDNTFRSRPAGGEGGNVVAVHETPLATVLARANKDSMNLYAESLCKRLGHDATGQSGSWANGTAALADYLRKAGVPDEQFKLDDGCGLSKENVISPRAINKVLAHAFHGKARDAYVISLSVAGVDGTLEDRFKGSDLRGRVMGKSGYVNGVRSLSGYLKAKDGQHYAFSILMNKVPDDGTIKTLQEKIVKAVDTHAAGLAAGE